MSELVPFEKVGKNSYLKKVIKEQGDMICREKIYQEIIYAALKKFDIGFANVIQKAQQGQRRKKADSVQITSFVLLSEGSKITPTYKELFLELICGMKNKQREGSQLLFYAIDYAKQNNYDRLSLQSLPEKELLDWYHHHGFKIIEMLYQKQEVKVVNLAIDLK